MRESVPAATEAERAVQRHLSEGLADGACQTRPSLSSLLPLGPPAARPALGFQQLRGRTNRTDEHIAAGGAYTDVTARSA